MNNRQGRGVNDVQLENRCLVLRTIVERPMVSRAEIAEATGLSKMSMTNIINELMQMGIVHAPMQERTDARGVGRRPGYLDLADTSPCVMGVFISRHAVQVTLGDLRTRILRTEKRMFPEGMDEPTLIALTIDALNSTRAGFTRPILGVGIAVIGPVSTERGTILSPANFFGLHDIPIVHAVRDASGYPVFLASDNMAGAQAEKLFGEGRAHSNFLFLLIWGGIGCGIIAGDKPYVGERGLAGELGHTSIRFDGSRCSCGATGCLELYANARQMAAHVRSRIAAGESSLIADKPLDWANICRAASRGDAPARGAVVEYCDYLACALSNMVNVFDPELIYLCQQEDEEIGGLLCTLLESSIRARMLAPDCRHMTVRSATFGADTAVVGSLALVVGHVFDGTLPFYTRTMEGN